MAGTVDFRQNRSTVTTESQRTWLTAALALIASFAMMLTAASHSASPVAYWTVSSIALATALVVFVAGQHAWGELVSSAQAAGVVER